VSDSDLALQRQYLHIDSCGIRQSLVAEPLGGSAAVSWGPFFEFAPWTVEKSR
jgi:hypothetical protein